MFLPALRDLVAGSSPMGPERQGVGAQVPGCHTGLLHYLLLLWWPEPGFCGQWE